MKDSAALYASARAAVVSYTREIALLPNFPPDAPIPETALGVVGAVVRVAATNKVHGEALPRTEDAWLAVRPFQDLSRTTLDAWKTALLERRMAAIALLVRLSASPQFGWNAMMDCGSQTTSLQDPKRSFWLNLLRDLGENVAPDRSMQMERNLVALSRSPSPRFLFCVDSDPSQVDFADLLDQLFWADKTDVVSGSDKKNVFEELRTTCGLPSGPIPERVVDIALSFTTGKITHAMVVKLLDVLDRLQSGEKRADGIKFRVTVVRFGAGCSVQPKAMETIAERWGPQYALTNLALGCIDGVKPASVKPWLTAVAQQSSTSLRRLAIAAGESFPAFASVFREASASSIEEVDVMYEISEENAAWLAFAFFHVDSKSTVSSICLRTAQDESLLTDDWINAFERALQSPTACEDLAGEEEEPNDKRERTFVKVKPATPVKSHAYAGAKLLWKVTSDEEGNDPEFERISMVKNLIGVVIPGIGLGWVPAASVTATRTQASVITEDEQAQTNRRVVALSIDRTLDAANHHTTNQTTPHQHITNVLRLLAIVGEPLERLHLPGCRFKRDDLGAILRYCPNLRELNISGHLINNISPLIDAYMADQCKIASLSLTQPLFLTNDDDTAGQLTELFHAKSNLPLRQLVMHLISCGSQSLLAPKVTTAVAQGFALALSANTNLEFVQLTTLTSATAGQTILLDSLPLDFSARPASQAFAMDRKLAFLSAVKLRSEQSGGDATSVWSRLDTLALSLVFTFSREAVARHVLRCK